MSDPNQSTNVAADDAQSANASGQIAVAAVFLTMVIVIVILILYLRRKGYSGATVDSSRHEEPTLPRNTLDRSILNSLPITLYQKKCDCEGVECAVCLCELTDGEEARFLPKCDHAFHVECIDTWFQSNSTCPLCRTTICPYSATNDEMPVEIKVEPNQEQESSASCCCSSSGRRKERMLVIDIPRRMMEGFSSMTSPLPSSRSVQGIKSPILEKMRSLGRMMRSGRGKGVSSSYTPKPGCDIEQGRM